MIVAAAALCTLLAQPPAAAPAPPAPTAPIGSWRPLTFEGLEGHTHEARLWSPEPDAANGVAVLLVCGGAAMDMHWTIPGSMPEADGKPDRQVTIDGQPTRDADVIARALVERGFTVLQWSMIHRDEPSYRDNPVLAAGLAYPDSVELTRRALRLLREQPGIDGRRIALVGHSLGATRACQVADEGTGAIVCLSGAYLSTLHGRPIDLAERALKACSDADIERNGSVDADEFRMWGERGDGPDMLLAGFIEMDRDHDGVLRGWELAAQTAIAGLMRGERDILETSAELRPGLAWPSEVLLSGTRPALVLYGGLDVMSVHGPLLERAARERNAAHITVEYVKDCGHQLGPERDSRLGPMDPAVVQRIGEWLSRACAPAPAAGRE